MSRRREATARKLDADQIYSSSLVTQLINCVMIDGKKSVAERIVYGAFEIIKEKSGELALDVFVRALEHVAPTVEVKSRRVGGATYQVPVEIRHNRRMALAIRWLVAAGKQKNKKNFVMGLAMEIIDAADSEGGIKGKGIAVKKRDDTHRMAAANQAFSHYNW